LPDIELKWVAASTLPGSSLLIRTMCQPSGDWIGDVDVPTSIVCTTEDRGVAPSLQLATAQAIRGATVHSVADGHLACANARFADPLVAACLDVAGRAT